MTQQSASKSNRVRIGIAIVESAGHVLVGTRAEGKALAGMSEFPGGKCEDDETPRTCVVRECREETGLIVIPRDLLQTKRWSYEHGDVELHFWRCLLIPDLPDLAPPRKPFFWVPAADLADLDFPGANAEIVRQLLADG